MKFKMVHNNFNVKNVAQSIAFYEKAFGLKEQSRKETADFIIVYLSDNQQDYLLELTQLHEHPQAYDLGENEIHLAFRTDDFEAAYKLHQEMGCICYENPAMGIYFVEDPDGYWLEVIPTR